MKYLRAVVRQAAVGLRHLGASRICSTTGNGASSVAAVPVLTLCVTWTWVYCGVHLGSEMVNGKNLTVCVCEGALQNT